MSGGIGGAARRAPDSPAILTLQGAITFAELDRRQRSIVGALSAAGVSEGDRVAVLSSNRPEYLEVTTAALRAGIVPVPISPLSASSGIDHILRDSEARWLFTDRAIEVPETVERLVTFGDAYERSLSDASPVDLFAYTRGRPMHYTSGTTGPPKGVWVDPYDELRAVRQSEGFRQEWGLGGDERHMVCSPLSHSAPHRYASRTLEAGGAVYLLPSFDAMEAIGAIALLGVTSTFMVPTHLERICALGDKEMTRFGIDSIRLLAHAGAPIREATKERAIDLFGGAVWEFYGSTEGQATRISTEEWLTKPGSVGTPRSAAHVSIRDPENRVQPPKYVGRIWITDPTADRFRYWNDPVRTETAWRGDSFSVGDLGHLDEDGYLFLNGRAGDMIITGGVNVYPHEVESVLLDHPSVHEAVVFARPDPEWGQLVCAAVVPAFGQPLDPELLRSWLRERLSGPQTPKQIEVVTELPRTPTGKIVRPSGD